MGGEGWELSLHGDATGSGWDPSNVRQEDSSAKYYHVDRNNLWPLPVRTVTQVQPRHKHRELCLKMGTTAGRMVQRLSQSPKGTPVTLLIAHSPPA